MNAFSERLGTPMTSRKEQRAATRGRVLAAAGELFGTRGFEATTVRDIAAEAGVSVGTVMAVGDKAALLVELFDQRIADLHRTRAEAPPVPPPARPPRLADEVLALFAPFVALFAEDPQLTRHYAAGLVTGRYAAGVFDELATLLRREISDVLVRADFAPDAAGRAATTIHLAYLGALFVGAGSGEPDASGPVEDLVAVVEFLTAHHEKHAHEESEQR
ncbi:TetR/AcrR family transcriptional regulator [Streptomyces sp. Da 82-17]|uniref:TetR/AcrR family transcriptional regulator n=1 Tax=Streptomyces sp. Da 82-17 TaxID=3377116 RepID=UPI0038D38963